MTLVEVSRAFRIKIAMRFFATLFLVMGLLSMAHFASAQDTQFAYTLGGSDVIFAFSRNGNTTTVFWPQFPAKTAVSTGLGGRINSGSTANLPAGYTLGSNYNYGTETIVRCMNLASGTAYMHIQSSPPVIVFSPLNGSDTDWQPDTTVVIESGSLTYLN